MKITSSAFEYGQTIPTKYGRSFENINPPLSISDVPTEAQSLVLLMDDPDVPEAAGVPVWDHWVVFNMSPSVREIPECWEGGECVRGQGTRGELIYGGPKPPDRAHRYFFKVLALDCVLDLLEGATKTEVLAAAQGHVLAQAELVGLFAPQ